MRTYEKINMLKVFLKMVEINPNNSIFTINVNGLLQSKYKDFTLREKNPVRCFSKKHQNTRIQKE